MEELEKNPFQSDIKKIKGTEDIFRLRWGSSRLYFKLDFDCRTIDILLFESRSQIKDKTIGRI